MSGRDFLKKLDERGLAEFLREWRQSLAKPEEIAYLCVGTDRSTGDALGPLVGSGLAAAGIGPVIGTLEAPCDADNLLDRLRELPEGYSVVAIDACLGHPSSVGKFVAYRGPLEPGRSLGRGFPPIGDCSVAGVVNAEGAKPYAVLQQTSLYRVMGMAEAIVRAVVSAVKD
ncbi:spore protease YyaC [Paenibacillus thermoaerophilus]|uniref:Spore protease YyaC n=1 Tax=Paenibacillus thermoaerophilus TaxID=1215385 RepID=A0ABW2V6T5_9BACL|nr:spore protease YyaC [Paenibacillus thermoaerophilus]TMV16135.1 spore protease YyaC [Paenibacillus thermoaerophilus]